MDEKQFREVVDGFWDWVAAGHPEQGGGVYLALAVHVWSEVHGEYVINPVGYVP
jgi:hypothetical protein